MIDDLLDILKIAFLVLLYLFFLRVLWVVLTEVRTSRSNAAAQGGFGGQATHLAEPIATPQPMPMPQPVPVPAARAKRGKKGGVGRLQVIEPRSRRGSSYGLADEITLGRSPGCTVAMTDDAFISNLHARVYVSNGEVVLEDLGSTNGTYLNGDRVQGVRPLRKGDRIQLGRTVLEAQ